jgi:hypothetical protein
MIYLPTRIGEANIAMEMSTPGLTRKREERFTGSLLGATARESSVERPVAGARIILSASERHGE